MTIPDFQTVMLPLLKFYGDGEPHQTREATATLGKDFSLSDEELRQFTPGGNSLVFHSRVSWANTYLSQAGVLNKVSRGVYQISPAGRHVLKEHPERIDIGFLKQFQTFRDFQNRTGTRSSRDGHQNQGQNSPGSIATAPEDETRDPSERLNAAYRELRGALAGELLDQVKQASPQFFEVLVIDLLVAMGYGGSRDDAGEAVGRSGDDGIDGIIKEDRLGLDIVYIQAKRWDNPVSRPLIQGFAGSLEGNRARKGVFITTSRFTADAREYVSRIEKRIVLIDGEQLANYMMDFGIGVTDVSVLNIHKIDQDYFEG